MRIGLFLNNLDEEYQISVYRGIRMEAEALNIDIVCVQGENPHHDQKFGRTPFLSREFIAADGILLLSSVILNRADFTRRLDMKTMFARVPFVSIGARLFEYPSIIIKCRKSMEHLMEHLTGFHGYRNLLYLGGPVNHQDNAVREHVFRRSVNAMKGQLPGLSGTVLNGEFHETSGMMMARAYIAANPDNPPDVIVAANDHIAIGAQETLHNQRDPRWRRCPVTGFDDIEQARQVIPALTTIRQPLDLLGRTAVRTLWDIIQGKKVPPVIHLDSELIIRESCGCKQEGKNPEPGDFPLPDKTAVQRRTINSEYHLRNISILGQSLATVNSHEEMLPKIGFFLTNIEVKMFYLVLYPRPLSRIGESGNLVYQRIQNQDISYTRNPRSIDIKHFFSGVIGEAREGPRTWCLYYLQTGNEYLGFIVYIARDSAHPQICGGAIFIANTVKRLRILDDEKERSRQLEQEVAFRTRDLVAANRKLQEEAKRRREVEAEVLRISEMERLRFSMDLHDDICQRLAGISMFCKSLTRGLSAESFLLELSELIDETLMRTRRYAHDAFPMELDALGLKEALGALCHSINKQTPCRCVYTWSAPEPSPLSSAQDINVYRIIQEALHNVVKHARAGRAEIDVRKEGPLLIVRVRDDGIGSSPQEGKPGPTAAKRREGLGLRSMEYRAHQLGAEYLFESGKTGGTLVELRIPLEK
jgi:signal transduction histidine kinase/DNA-binding LacI/PurR family transcriptional regulator